VKYPMGVVGDLATIEMGQSPNGELVQRARSGLPLLNGPTEFGAQHPTPAQWTEAGVRFARAGDVLFCVRGSTTGRMNLADQDYAIGRGIAALRARDGVDSRIVKYSLDASLDELLAGVSGSVFPNLSRIQILNHPVPVPPLPEQRAIAEVLGALDDKIAANTALATSLYSLIEGEYEQTAGSARGVRRLSDLVTTQYGVTASATDERGGVGLLRVTDINKRPWINWPGVPGCDLTETEERKYRLASGDIVVARMADPGKCAWIAPGDPEAVFASYLVRLRALEPNHAPFIFQFLRSPAYLRHADGVGQGSVQKNMNAKAMVAISIPMPDDDAVAMFATRFRHVWEAMTSALRENRTLSATRDALLPKLMSGKLRVRDAELAASEAGA